VKPIEKGGQGQKRGGRPGNKITGRHRKRQSNREKNVNEVMDLGRKRQTKGQAEQPVMMKDPLGAKEKRKIRENSLSWREKGKRPNINTGLWEKRRLLQKTNYRGSKEQNVEDYQRTSEMQPRDQGAKLYPRTGTLSDQGGIQDTTGWEGRNGDKMRMERATGNRKV